MKKKLEKRMYYLTMYNISSIQAGIQSLHATVEYALKYGKNKEYIDWAKNWKTVVLLNGGTSNKGIHSQYGEPKQIGSMETHLETLRKNKIKCTPFYEPDLNYSLSAIAFLVDEMVFNKIDFPDYVQTTVEEYGMDNIAPEEQFNRAYTKFVEWEKKEYTKKFSKEVVFLKEFLKQFKLA